MTHFMEHCLRTNEAVAMSRDMVLRDIRLRSVTRSHHGVQFKEERKGRGIHAGGEQGRQKGQDLPRYTLSEQCGGGIVGEEHDLQERLLTVCN